MKKYLNREAEEEEEEVENKKVGEENKSFWMEVMFMIISQVIQARENTRERERERERYQQIDEYCVTERKRKFGIGIEVLLEKEQCLFLSLFFIILISTNNDNKK